MRRIRNVMIAAGLLLPVFTMLAVQIGERCTQPSDCTKSQCPLTSKTSAQETSPSTDNEDSVLFLGTIYLMSQSVSEE